MSDPGLRGLWRDLGERIKDDPHDLDAWTRLLAIGRVEYERSSVPGQLGRWVVVLDEERS